MTLTHEFEHIDLERRAGRFPAEHTGHAQLLPVYYEIQTCYDATGCVGTMTYEHILERARREHNADGIILCGGHLEGICEGIEYCTETIQPYILER